MSNITSYLYKAGHDDQYNATGKIASWPYVDTGLYQRPPTNVPFTGSGQCIGCPKMISNPEYSSERMFNTSYLNNNWDHIYPSGNNYPWLETGINARYFRTGLWFEKKLDIVLQDGSFAEGPRFKGAYIDLIGATALNYGGGNSPSWNQGGAKIHIKYKNIGNDYARLVVGFRIDKTDQVRKIYDNYYDGEGSVNNFSLLASNSFLKSLYYQYLANKTSQFGFGLESTNNYVFVFDSCAVKNIENEVITYGPPPGWQNQSLNENTFVSYFAFWIKENPEPKDPNQITEAEVNIAGFGFPNGLVGWDTINQNYNKIWNDGLQLRFPDDTSSNRHSVGLTWGRGINIAQTKIRNYTFQYLYQKCGNTTSSYWNGWNYQTRGFDNLVYNGQILTGYKVWQQDNCYYRSYLTPSFCSAGFLGIGPRGGYGIWNSAQTTSQAKLSTALGLQADGNFIARLAGGSINQLDSFTLYRQVPQLNISEIGINNPNNYINNHRRYQIPYLNLNFEEGGIYLDINPRPGESYNFGNLRKQIGNSRYLFWHSYHPLFYIGSTQIFADIPTFDDYIDETPPSQIGDQPSFEWKFNNYSGNFLHPYAKIKKYLEDFGTVNLLSTPSCENIFSSGWPFQDYRGSNNLYIKGLTSNVVLNLFNLDQNPETYIINRNNGNPYFTWSGTPVLSFNQITGLINGENILISGNFGSINDYPLTNLYKYKGYSGNLASGKITGYFQCSNINNIPSGGPSLICSTYINKQKLIGDSAEDIFGVVASNSDASILVMGGPLDDDGGTNAGAALVYTGNKNIGWQLRQKLISNSPGGFFGTSIDINSDGTVIIMGGNGDDDAGIDAGAALIYTGNSDVGWQLKQKLTGDSAGDQYGKSVAINNDGTVLIIGGDNDNEGGPNVGAGLVYTGNLADGWQLKQKLIGVNIVDSINSPGPFFGNSVAINGDGSILMMGGPYSNSALIYKGSPILGWEFAQRLLGDTIFDNFGMSVATNNDGTILIMGGNGDDDSGTNAGAALVYTGNALDGWQLKQKILSNSPTGQFGRVAINSDGTVLLMGGTSDSQGGAVAGASLVYTGNAINGWQLKQKLVGDSAGDQFSSVDTNSDGTVLLMGGFLDDDGGTNAGAALVYSLENTPCSSSSSSSNMPPPLIPPSVVNCSNSNVVKFESFNGFNRAVILKGTGLSINPDLGCECLNQDKNCNILNNLPNNIQKVLDTNCINTSFTGNLIFDQNDLYKYLVIPDCNNSNPNTTWNFSVSPICCNNQYSVNFWSYTAPSRLVILAGSGLLANSGLFCDCISNDKNCSILNSLPQNIYKVLDTNCVLTNQTNFNQTIDLPSDLPNFVLVIPDCLNQNTGATWNLNITPYCAATGGCQPCAVASGISCSFDYTFSLSPTNPNIVFKTFEKVTSYKDDQLNKIIVGTNNGFRGYKRDLGFIVESVDINPFLPSGVKGVTYPNVGGINFEYPVDTFVRIEENKFRLKENESWTQDFSLFNKYSYNNLSQEEAGAVIPTNTNVSLGRTPTQYDIEYKGYTSNQSANSKYKQKFVIKQFPEENVGVPIDYSFNSGWVSYDVTSGMNFKNVFSYAVQIVDKLTFTEGFLIEGENRITGRQDIINWIRSGLAPVLTTGTMNSFSSLSAYCLEGPTCPEPPEQCTKTTFGGGDGFGGKPCPIECWTGNNITGAEYYDWLTGTLNKYKDKTELLKSNNVYGKIITGNINAPFTSLSGNLRYNTWTSGDKFKFTVYPFDYTGLYKALHLGNNPPYPQYNVELIYPRDWTNMYNFVDKLNEKLRDVSIPIWYPYLCLSGSPSGYYVDGPLMEFKINTGTCCLPSGDLDIMDFQNRIDFKSLRSLPGLPKTGQQIKDEDLCLSEIKSDGSGRSPWYFKLQLDLSSQERRGYNIYSGYSYLIPTCVEFQRLENNNWITVDKNCNLYNKITGVEQTCIVKQISGIIDPKDGYLNQNYASSVTGSSLTEEDLVLELENTTGQAGIYRTLLNFQQKITVNSRGKCQGWVDVKDIDFVWPENFPTGIVTKGGKLSGVDNRYWCKRDQEESPGGCSCPPLSPKPDCSLPPGSSDRYGAKGGYGPDCIPKIMIDEECKCKEWYCECPSESVPPIEICQIRTGWNFTGNFGLQAKTGSFDKYRLVFSNFSGQNLENYKPLNEFYIGNINLFSITGGIPLPELTGTEKCPIGADYVVDVFGTVPLRLTGVHNYSINESMSGVYTNYFEVVRPVLPEERNIKFNKVSGIIVSEFATGFWSKTLRPSGWACRTFDDYFFYDRNSKEITFEKTICAYASGFTGLSGSFIALKQSVVNRELLIGGRFNTPIGYITYTGVGIYTGFIDNVTYKEYDVVGYYPITGYITGYTKSGFLDIGSTITGLAPVNGDKYPYYPIPTGFINASGYIEVDFSKIKNFDYFTIYGNNFIYHSNISEYPFPSYFSNMETLYQIVSGIGPDLGISSLLDDNKIFIKSLRTGTLGNTPITTTNTGAFNIFGMSGGQDIFPRIYNYYYVINNGYISGIEIVPMVTGSINSFILATGFYYSNSGTGTVTGNISTFTGVRYFTGVWDIATGNISTPFQSFLSNRWISGNSFIRENNYSPNYLNYIKLRAFYLNQLSTFLFESPDIADLIIKDNNNPDISGSGIIFRLSGVK